MFPQDMAFVLVRSSEAGNLGATARIMKNFGFTDLRLVSPEVDYLENEDKWMAVGAYDLLQKCRVFATLQEALCDVALSVGTTSARLRAVRAVDFIPQCEEARAVSAHNKVAWVFGNERNGLTREELELCHCTTSIPTDSLFPVLNVAQSTAIVAYECVRSLPTSAIGEAQPQLPTVAEEDQLFGKVDTLIKDINFTRTFNHQLVITELRSAFRRIRPTMREFGLLNGIVLRILDRLQKTQAK